MKLKWRGGKGGIAPVPPRMRTPLLLRHKIAGGRGRKGLPRAFPTRLRLLHPHITKRGRPPYRSRSASGTPPLTRPRLLPHLPDVHIYGDRLGTYSGTQTVVTSPGSVVPTVSAPSSPLSRLSLVFYCPDSRRL